MSLLGDVSLQHVVETILHQQLCVLVDCISQPYEAVSRLGCSCIRFIYIHWRIVLLLLLLLLLSSSLYLNGAS